MKLENIYIEQDYDRYAADDHEVWATPCRRLFDSEGQGVSAVFRGAGTDGSGPHPGSAPRTHRRPSSPDYGLVGEAGSRAYRPFDPSRWR